MDEYWDVYNQFREKTGKVIKRDGLQRLQEGEFHIVITGIIQNQKEEILISKRKESKELYGRIMGMYEWFSKERRKNNNCSYKRDRGRIRN